MRKTKIFLATLTIFLGLSSIAYVSESKNEEGANDIQQGIVYYESEEAGGPEIVYAKPVKGVLFSHKYHVKELGMPCESCHSGIFEMQALKSQENPDFVMDSLYKGKYCGACHNGQAAFASNTKCATCHIGVKGLREYQKKLVQSSKK